MHRHLCAENPSTCIRDQVFDLVGAVPVGACPVTDEDRDEDRAITLLRPALLEMENQVGAIAEVVPPERRGVAAATSKGGVLLYTRNPSRATGRLMELLPDAPARWIAEQTRVSGPVAGYVSACATGLHNIIRGADWIREGYADAVIAGSSEATLTPLYLASFLNLGAMTRDACRPYDPNRSGFVPGEGAALFLLTRRDIADRARLPVVVRIDATASLAEAHHPTAVNVDGHQVERLIRRTLGDIPAHRIDAISTHGTGTRQNDEAEAAGIRRVFGDTQPPVFSTKGAIGHLMGATGSVELAACLWALHHQTVPATVGHQTLAPECHGLRVLTAPTPSRIDTILKWNLGFGGHLAAAIISRDPSGDGNTR